MQFRHHLITFSFLFILVCSVQADDVNFPYARINLKLPPAEDPCPGLGNYYSALSYGLATVRWNPASLAKLKLSEFNLSMKSAGSSTHLTKISSVREERGTFEVGAGTGVGGKASMDYALFFRPYSSLINEHLNTKEVEVQSSINQSTSSTGMNFAAAQRVNDWLVVGFSSNNPIEADIDFAGNFPVTGRLGLDLYGKSMGNMAISTAGKLSYTFTSGGVTTTPETVNPVWSGFLTQEVTIPLTAISELRNNINIDSPYIGTIAAQKDKFYAGLNFIPIAASAQIDNDVRTVVNSDVPDQLFYTPNFDPNDATQGGNWLADQDKYGTPAGYSRKQIILPSGEIIANTKYRGFYTGSATRMDLGFMYDISETFTVGMALENMGGASLNMKGSGLAAYMTYRDFNSGEVDTLLQPGSNTSWAPISDRWITTFEAGKDQPLLLDAEKNYSLPKKMRIGLAIKRPFTITIDYEQNQTPIVVRTSDEASQMTISDLNFIRLGMESQLFSFPVVFRTGTTFMLKPSVSSTDTKMQDNINKVFKFGVVPVKMDFGTVLNLWGYKYEDAIGFNALSLINLFQLDTSNIDLTKTLFFSMGIGKDAWQVRYLYELDPVSTAAVYFNNPPTGDGGHEFNVPTDTRFMQTLGVTYRF